MIYYWYWFKVSISCISFSIWLFFYSNKFNIF